MKFGTHSQWHKNLGPKIEIILTRLGNIDKKLEQINASVSNLERKFDRLENKVQQLEEDHLKHVKQLAN